MGKGLREAPGVMLDAAAINNIINPRAEVAMATGKSMSMETVREVIRPVFVPSRIIRNKSYLGTAMFASHRLALDEVQALQSQGFRVKLNKERTPEGSLWVVWVETTKW